LKICKNYPFRRLFIAFLEKNFTINIDYKTALQFGKAILEKQNGGQNKQTILLTIKCFKSLCLKAQTKKDF
jgi:hypothetical protein